MLNATEVAATAEAIAAVQLPTGMILWFEGGHADPWNHVEAVMALTVAGRIEEARAGFSWLQESQHDDGGWYHYYLADGIESARRDTNVCAYVAVGAWHHHLATGDRRYLEQLWPMVDRALDWVVALQQPGGEILWCYEADGQPGRFALLTSSSSIFTSLRCGLAAAAVLGHVRPHWELAAARLAHAVAHRPEAFEPKERWAMDWYYPVLCGAVTGLTAAQRLQAGWATFVMPGLGVRCVSDRPWVTAAETAELVLALDACGLRNQARELFSWLRALRHEDGSYWTGMVHPERVHFPGGERSSYTAAAVLLANEALWPTGRTAGLFRGDGLPTIVPVDAEQLTRD